MTIFNEEAEQALDEYTEELTEARREEALIFYEGCTIITAPTGPPPEYLTVTVDTINDPNVHWRGIPTLPAAGDEVIVWENPLSHRREIWGGSGTSGVSGGASWCQVVVVAKCGGDFDDITDAIAWINAMAAPPAANLLYVLYVLAGNWVEGAIVTVPPFVTLRGMGDGTSIEMGAFDLIMDDDSNLFDVKVTFAASGSLLISSKDRVILEHVHGTQTSNDDVLFVDGTSSDVECKDCWFESAGNEAVYVKDSAAIRFDNCKFEAHAGAGYAFVLDDTATVRMEWCELTAYVPVFTVAGTTFDHFSCQFDLAASTLAAGSHTALSTKRFNQTLVVAEAGGEFTSLGAAIIYINAQADAAAGKLYGVLMLDGNYAEAASVTIPSYVHVGGKGEGTEIEMAANQQLVLASYSSLMDVVVEGSPGAANEVIYTNNVVDVLLRNVKAINGSAVGYCFGFAGSSVIRGYHCVAETSAANAIGFYVGGTSQIYLEDCIADDSTNFGWALFTTDTACTVTTQKCTFQGATDDVNIAAAATWNFCDCRFRPSNCTLLGTANAYNADAGDNYAFVVKNTSGATRAVGDVGYIDEAGEFKTTTTQYHDVNWCVVVVGGLNNADIYVARRGRVTVKLDANCAIGDFLYTSGTATQATPQTYMRPEMFAVALTANAGGAGGTCSALLYCHTKFIAMKDAIPLYSVQNADASNFRAQISGVAAAVVTWNAVGVGGSGNTIDPAANNYHGKVRLYNETDADYALIDDVNVGARQITVTNAADVAGWAIGEWITARSQTCIAPAPPPYYFDFDFSSADNTVVPVLARGLSVQASCRDSAAADITVFLHPWEVYGGGKRFAFRTQAVNVYNSEHGPVPLIQRRFCHAFQASGAGTVDYVLRLAGYWEAAP